MKGADPDFFILIVPPNVYVYVYPFTHTRPHVYTPDLLYHEESDFREGLGTDLDISELGGRMSLTNRRRLNQFQQVHRKDKE